MFGVWRDSSSEAQLKLIARSMVDNFDISYEEARARVNYRFCGVRILGEDHPIYLESVDSWASFVMYGRDVFREGGLRAERLPPPTYLHAFASRLFVWHCWRWVSRWWKGAVMLVRSGKFPILWPNRICGWVRSRGLRSKS